MATEDTAARTSSASDGRGDQWTETYVDVVELVTEGAQRAWDGTGRFTREHPYVAGAIAAVAAGAVVGVVLASLVPRRHPPSRMERARETLRQRGRGFSVRPPGADGGLDRARSAMELVPIGVRLLRNPLVRELGMRMAMQALRRRKR